MFLDYISTYQTAAFAPGDYLKRMVFFSEADDALSRLGLRVAHAHIIKSGKRRLQVRSHRGLMITSA